MTMKCHGLRFEEDGAAMAAWRIVLMSVSFMGWVVYFRMLRLARIVLMSSFPICWFPLGL